MQKNNKQKNTNVQIEIQSESWFKAAAIFQKNRGAINLN
jgi:hypothetical protein